MQALGMNPNRMPWFQKNFAGRILAFQKAGFENALAIVEVFQEQAAGMASRVWHQIPWLPEGTEPLVAGWIEALQEGSKNLHRAAREVFECMEESLVQDDGKQTPDVLLDVPGMNIDEIRLKVDTLEARVSLKAELANLIRINVGANADIGKVDLDIRGAEAQALLKVRLEQVNAILSRALEVLDHNPDLMRSLVNPVGEAAGKAGKEAGRALGEMGERVEGALTSEGSLHEVVKGVAAREGPVREALEEVSKGIGEAVQRERRQKKKK